MWRKTCAESPYVLVKGGAPPSSDVYFERVARTQLTELMFQVTGEVRQELVSRLVWHITDGQVPLHNTKHP
jgi:hypothetical protein